MHAALMDQNETVSEAVRTIDPATVLLTPVADLVGEFSRGRLRIAGGRSWPTGSLTNSSRSPYTLAPSRPAPSPLILRSGRDPWRSATRLEQALSFPSPRSPRTASRPSCPRSRLRTRHHRCQSRCQRPSHHAPNRTPHPPNPRPLHPRRPTPQRRQLKRKARPVTTPSPTALSAFFGLGGRPAGSSAAMVVRLGRPLTAP